MGGRAATEAEKKRAVELYVTHGPSEAARQVGFSKGSVCAWAKAAGVKTNAPQLLETATAVSVARRKLTMAQWREEMTELLQEISVQAATVEAQLLRGRGKATPALDKATSARGKALSDLMLLTGEATQRVGLSGDVSEKAEQVARLRDDLAERRAQAG